MYLAVNGALCLAYLICWAVFWEKEGKLKALALSVLPTAVFLFGGIMLASIPLTVFAVVFGVCHILISYKNSI